jgi:hypothetical protein
MIDSIDIREDSMANSARTLPRQGSGLRDSKCQSMLPLGDWTSRESRVRAGRSPFVAVSTIGVNKAWTAFPDSHRTAFTQPYPPPYPPQHPTKHPQHGEQHPHIRTCLQRRCGTHTSAHSPPGFVGCSLDRIARIPGHVWIELPRGTRCPQRGAPERNTTQRRR